MERPVIVLLLLTPTPLTRKVRTLLRTVRAEFLSYFYRIA